MVLFMVLVHSALWNQYLLFYLLRLSRFLLYLIIFALFPIQQKNRRKSLNVKMKNVLAKQNSMCCVLPRFLFYKINKTAEAIEGKLQW